MIILSWRVASAFPSADATCFPITDLVSRVVAGGRSPRSVVVEEWSVCADPHSSGAVPDLGVLGELARPIDDTDWDGAVRILRRRGSHERAELYARKAVEDGSPSDDPIVLERYSEDELLGWLARIAGAAEAFGPAYQVRRDGEHLVVAPLRDPVLDRVVTLRHDQCAIFDDLAWSPMIAYECAFAQLGVQLYVGLGGGGDPAGLVPLPPSAFPESPIGTTLGEMVRTQARLTARGRTTLTRVELRTNRDDPRPWLAFRVVPLPADPPVIPRVNPFLLEEVPADGSE